MHQAGVLGSVFPFGTQKQTYQVYDPTLKRTAPFTYTRSGTVNGIPEGKRSLGRVFMQALVKHPQLIPVAARCFV